MDQRFVRLRTHQMNIAHYENVLNTKLTDDERAFIERRLSEERLRTAMLQFMNPSAPKPPTSHLPGMPE
jgi:hypothetical protein